MDAAVEPTGTYSRRFAEEMISAIPDKRVLSVLWVSWHGGLRSAGAFYDGARQRLSSSSQPGIASPKVCSSRDASMREFGGRAAAVG